MTLRNGKHESIRDRMISVNVYKAGIPSILLALVLMFISITVSTFQLTTRSQDIIKSIESSTATYLDRYFSSLDEIYYAVFKTSTSREALQDSLDAYNNSNDEIMKIWIVDDRGVSEIGSPYSTIDRGYDHSGHAYFSGLDEVGQVLWSDVFVTIGSNEPIVTVSKKYLDAVVVLRINLTELTDNLRVFDISENSYIAVTDTRGAYLAHTDNTYVSTRGYDPNRVNLMAMERGYVEYNDSFMFAYHRVLRDTQWSIIYYQALLDIMLPIIVSIGIGIVILVIIGIRSLIAVMNLNNDILRELDELVYWTSRVSNGEYGKSAKSHVFNEFEQLSTAFNRMLNGILKRESELEDKRVEIVKINAGLEEEVQKRTMDLELSLNELKATQNQLVIKEKMAALGNLVSGVAHELNTPIGVAVTAASYLEQKNVEINVLLDESKINKRDFFEYINAVDESSQIILRNMERASELIRSFKKVAIDQQKMSLKQMDLKSVIEATVTSYSVELKKQHVESKLEFIGDMVGESYPGAISQVVSNLIQNSLVHAFNENEKPLIGIECEVDELENVFIINYWDNGKGIHADHVDKIYDPFYTTALSEGGTGLGMNIVYNLVTSLLQGEIEYVERPNVGVFFKLTIPKMLN